MTDRLIHPYILPVVNAFEMVSDAEKAVYMEAYMRNQFPFLVIQEFSTKLRPVPCHQVSK